MSASHANARTTDAEQLPALRTSFVGARVAPPRPKPSPRRRRTERQTAAVVLVLAFALLAAFAAQASVRQALSVYWAAWARSGGLERGLAFGPANPVALRRAAFLASQRSGDPSEASTILREAVAVAPLELTPRLELAATLEASGQNDEAEDVLLDAAKLDSGYRPRWSLTNLYLRQGRMDKFWESAQSTLLAYPESAPMVLGLCWRAFGDSTLILKKGVPHDSEVYRRYFSYLLEQRRLDALVELWPKLAPVMEARDVPTASLFLDRLIADERVESSIEVWNHLCRGQFLSYAPLQYPAGPYLTNGDFVARISGVGFDWKVPPAQGVFRVQRPTEFGSRALEVRLTGGQGDNALLLSQVAPLPSGRYLFRYEYATQRLPRLTGLFWIVRDNETDRVLAQSPFIEAAEDYWNTVSFLFDAPPDVKFFRLEFRYLRAEGTERHRGRYVMRRAALSAVGSPAD